MREAQPQQQQQSNHNSGNTMTADTGSNPRIPLGLQQVFLKSLGGDDVETIEAPKNGLAFKMFRRGGDKKRAIKQQQQRGNHLRRNNVSTSSLHSTEDSCDASMETAADASVRHMRKQATRRVSIGDSTAELSPGAFLDKAIGARGYATKKYGSLDGGYYCRPTPLQQASYGNRMSMAVRSGDRRLLRRLLDSGLSPNPCNNFGESLVHMVCRRGDHDSLRVLLEAGCSLQVTDDYGRTPLHDACWRAEPSFETIRLILRADKNLMHMLDCRGASPLAYVKRDCYAPWVGFLQSELDNFWPARDVAVEGEERPPPLSLRAPHSLPIPDPVHALPLEVAAMVANGRMEPEEAIYLDDESSDEEDSEEDSDDDMSYSDDDSYDSDDSDFDEAEMAEICLRAGGPMRVAQKVFGKDVSIVGRGGFVMTPSS